jgi:peptidoglycan/LPS O-acetylase OafA/YrhL
MPSSTPPLHRPASSPSAPGPANKQTAVLAACADAALILVFAAIGRDAHQRGDVVIGVFSTAWPFLAGAALSWLALRVWRAPLAVWPAGVGVWLGTVTIGMVLRAVTGQTVVLPFVVVALLSLGLLLLGYRLLAAGVRRLNTRRRGA